MQRFYQEHPDFGEFTRFDTTTGKLDAITEDDFRQIQSSNAQSTSQKGIGKTDAGSATVFSGETPQTRTRFPRRIYFQITRNCNLRCPYCFIKADRGQAHVPTSAALEVASFMGRNGLMEVRLTGGEPTTHPDFFPIVDAFRAQDVYVSVATNGVISREILDGLADRPNLWVICSIDGNRTTHNRYRPGTFDTILENLDQLRSKCPDIRIRLTTVLTRENMGQIRELGQIVKSLAAESITIIPLRPQVRLAAVKAEMVTAAEFRRVLEEMVAVMDDLNIRMTTTLATDLEGHIHKDPVVRKWSSCAAGREATNLDYDSRERRFLVYGCSYSPASDPEALPEIRRPFLAGTFPVDRVADFLDIWRDDPAWAIYRDAAFKSSECGDCDFHRTHQCVGSCPIQNIDYTNIDVRRDVINQLKTQIAQTSEWYCYRRLLSDRSRQDAQ